jgi:hypothetical protein
VIDPQTRDALTQLARRESRSLLLYVRDAFPWTTMEDQAALGQLQRLVAEEEEANAAIIRYLYKQRVPLPYVGAYPMSFTTINFVSLEHLLPLLIDYEQRSQAQAQEALSLVRDEGARALVQRLIELKHNHLQELRALERSAPHALEPVNA